MSPPSTTFPTSSLATTGARSTASIAASFPAKRAGMAASAQRGAEAVARWLVFWVRIAAHRRNVRTLLELDERSLRDIGLVRNDVLGALSYPLHHDPSTVLMMRSVERRSRARLLADAADQASRGR